MSFGVGYVNSRAVPPPPQSLQFWRASLSNKYTVVDNSSGRFSSSTCLNSFFSYCAEEHYRCVVVTTNRQTAQDLIDGLGGTVPSSLGTPRNALCTVACLNESLSLPLPPDVLVVDDSVTVEELLLSTESFGCARRRILFRGLVTNTPKVVLLRRCQTGGGGSRCQSSTALGRHTIHIMVMRRGTSILLMSETRESDCIVLFASFSGLG